MAHVLGDGTAESIAIGKIVGIVNNQATMWDARTFQFTSLHPNGASSSSCYGVGGAFQAGRATFNGGPHAIRWNGAANSFLDLDTGRAEGTIGRATDGIQVVGEERRNANMESHAILWDADGNWTDLTPVGVRNAVPTGVANGVQVGWARIDGAKMERKWGPVITSPGYFR